MSNITRNPKFTQVCVWPGTVVGQDDIENFVEFIWDEFGVRVQYLEEIKTNPDTDQGVEVEGTGGRNDVFFAVHDDDVGKFAVARLIVGIRWLEDVLSPINNNRDLYPSRVSDYTCWVGE